MTSSDICFDNRSFVYTTIASMDAATMPSHEELELKDKLRRDEGCLRTSVEEACFFKRVGKRIITVIIIAKVL